MVLKLLFFAFLFFVVTRYLGRMFLPSTSKNKNFNPFGGANRGRKKNFDQIEEAEYEDLSDKKNT